MFTAVHAPLRSPYVRSPWPLPLPVPILQQKALITLAGWVITPPAFWWFWHPAADPQCRRKKPDQPGCIHTGENRQFLVRIFISQHKARTPWTSYEFFVVPEYFFYHVIQPHCVFCTLCQHILSDRLTRVHQHHHWLSRNLYQSA